MASWMRKNHLLLLLTALAVLSLLLQHITLSRTSLTAQPQCPPADSVDGIVQRFDNGTAERRDVVPSSADKCSCSKVVLMHSFPYYYELKPGSQVFDQCDHSCTISLDLEKTPEADCVVFYSHHWQMHTPPARQSQSAWVYFAVESPFHSANQVLGEPAWQGQINWTMTYRHDSDMYFGYGLLTRKPAPMPRNGLVDIYRGKKKMVAWFVSNCNTQSKREAFVVALKNYITVDVYGKCGDFKCGQEGDMDCYNMLSRDYYFYLSFENSLCKDYLTEKLYRTLEVIDIVPVVRGGANYSAILPQKSFIDVNDFSSVKDLADFLKKLASNEAAYLSYLDWKKDWDVAEPMPLPLCELCRRVHNQHKYQKTYDNVDDWWRKGICKDPPTVVM